MRGFLHALSAFANQSLSADAGTFATADDLQEYDDLEDLYLDPEDASLDTQAPKGDKMDEDKGHLFVEL